MGNRRTGAHNREKANTRKIVGRLTYSPGKHKQKFAKTLREKLASRPPAKAPAPLTQKTSMKFGSLNVNGLDEEAHWAVIEILKQHDLDVCCPRLQLKDN